MQEDSLGALLELLGDGPEASGTVYRSLHRRLTRFFRINARTDPESLADEVLNRLAKVAVINASTIASPEAFAVGIARHVLQEDVRAQIREADTGHDWQFMRTSADPTEETMLQAIDACLASLPRAKSDLLRTYYEWTGKHKIDHHRQLAARLGLNINALRNRLMRARRELDTCVRTRLRDVLPITRTPSGDKEASN